MSNQSVPRGMPELPFGMKWEVFKTRDDMFQAEVILALETRLHIHVFRYSSTINKGAYPWGCKVSMKMESVRGSYGMHIDGPVRDTPQDAAKAAIDLLAPFVQLSKIGSNP